MTHAIANAATGLILILTLGIIAGTVGPNLPAILRALRA